MNASTGRRELGDRRGGGDRGILVGAIADVLPPLDGDGPEAPAVSISMVAEKRSYVLGTVPEPSCAASDMLSGVGGAGWVGALRGANVYGVNSFTYTGTATNRAGSVATESVSFKVVYRFDGYLQPINDPSAVPGAARSAFKAGSTIPVKSR